MEPHEALPQWEAPLFFSYIFELWWWWKTWWNEWFWQGKPKYSEKTCPDATGPWILIFWLIASCLIRNSNTGTSTVSNLIFINLNAEGWMRSMQQKVELRNHLSFSLKTEGNDENQCRYGCLQGLLEPYCLLASSPPSKWYTGRLRIP
jgi:hypothetical protein